MGSLDKILRAFFAAILVILYFQKVLTGIWATVGLIVAGLLVLTSFLRFCPLYTLFGWRTCPANPKAD